MLRVLQYISTKIDPSWVQSINQADLLRSRPLLQLRFSSDSIANVAIMLIVDQFLALTLGRESSFNPLSVLPSSPRQAICYADVKNRIDPVCDDVDPEVVIARHGSGTKMQRCLDFARHDIRVDSWSVLFTAVNACRLF